MRDVDISIAVGETGALLGPNCAGKSTTIDMLLGLTRPTRRRYLWLGGVGRRQSGSGEPGVL